MHKRIWLLLLAGLLAACRPEAVPEGSAVEWENCRQQLAESETLMRLTGRWQLAATGCGDCTQQGPVNATEQVRLLISANQKLELFRDGILIHTSDFVLKPAYNPGYFALQTIPHNPYGYTNGVVELCPDRLVFNSGYTDGPIYFFRRIP